ncbi:hypothetical protein [Glacieibacterium sp.]|uniref:hypothetical protein n=1 Tax=Glacieibacterium sp. TaxID=2860237 RepID=UPI003AFFA8D1
MISTGRALRQPLALALVALLVPATVTARKAPPSAPAPDVITSRMVVDKQLAARSPTSGTGLGGAEARRIHDRYLSRIGVPLETGNTASSGRNGSRGGQ